MAKNQDYAEYLAADFIDNRLFEDMTVREYVEMEVHTSDVASRDSVAEDFDSVAEAIEDLTAYVEDVYAQYSK